MTQRHLIGTTLFTAIAAAAAAQTTANERVITAPAVEIQDSRLAALDPARTQVELSLGGALTNPVSSVADTAANFFLADSGARSFTNSVTLRGLSNTPLFGEASVAVYLDDMPLGSAFTFPTELAGLENAELVRGFAHNTAAGRAGTAGLLRFNTPVGAPSTQLRASFGNYSARSATGSTLVDAGQVEMYAAIGYSARDGYIDSTVLGGDIDWKESTSGLARVKFTASENLELRFLATAQRVRDGVQALVPLGGPLFEVSRSAEGTTPLRSYGLSGQAALTTPHGKLSATTSYTDWRLTGASNVLDLGFAELVNQSRFGQKVLSEEIKFESRELGNLQWSGGLFASTGESSGGFTRFVFGAPFEQSVFETDHDSLSAFGEATWTFRPNWSVTAGLRAEANWKDLYRVETVPMDRTFERAADSTALLPRLAVSYRWDTRAEATLGLGSTYKPGGFSAFTGNRALSRFGPERNVGIDAAYTRRASDRRWSVTLRAFAYQIEGYQIERSFQTGGFSDDYLVVNADRARSLGGELEFSWKPSPELSFDFSAGLTDITLREFADPFTGTRYDGNKAPLAPEHDIRLGATYHHSSGFAVSTDVSQVGRTYYTEDEDQMFSQSSFTRVGARLGYVKANFEVWIYGENVLDREYYTSILPGTFHATPGAPRTYGVSASYSF